MANSATHLKTTFHIGDTVRVDYKIVEKEIVSGKTKKEKHEEQKERTQGFSGIVIYIKGVGVNQSFCVRHMGVGNIGVERILPIASPWIKKVVVVKKGQTRRAKLYYLRTKTKKEVAKMSENSPLIAEVPEEKAPVVKKEEVAAATVKAAETKQHAPEQPTQG